MNNEELAQIKKEAQSFIVQCIQNQKYEDAYKILNEYKTLYSTDPDIIVLDAMLSYEQNQIKEAEKILNNGAYDYPVNEYIRYNLGFMKEQSGDHQGALYNYYIAQITSSNKQITDDVSYRLSNISNNLSQDFNEIINNYREDLPKVDVIITAYNQEKYLKQTINSILDQDYPNIEIFVADDCSTDGTEQMMKEYQNHCKVSYKRNLTNLGPGNNGCHAFYEYANGKYTLFVNHDDYLIESNYITKAVTLLESNKQLSMVWANCTLLVVDTGKTYPIDNDLQPVTKGMKYFMFYETKEYPHINSLFTSVFRRENAVRMKCLTEQTKSLDLFLYLKLMLTGDIGFIPVNAGVYRMHKASISYNMPVEFDYSTIDELKKLKEMVNYKFNIDRESLDIWLDLRIHAYLKWRFSVLKRQGHDLLISEMMNLLQKEYPRVYKLLQEQYEEV